MQGHNTLARFIPTSRFKLDLERVRDFDSDRVLDYIEKTADCAGIEFPISYPLLHGIYPLSPETPGQEFPL